MIYLVTQLREKSHRKDCQIDKLTRKVKDLEARNQNSKVRKYDMKRKSQIEPPAENTGKLKQELQTVKDGFGLVLAKSEIINLKLEETTNLLKQAGFAKLCFLSFYKEFEEIMETRPIPEL